MGPKENLGGVKIYSWPWLWCLYMFKFITLYTSKYLQFLYINYTIKLLKPDVLPSSFFFFTIPRTLADNSLLFCFSYKGIFLHPSTWINLWNYNFSWDLKHQWLSVLRNRNLFLDAFSLVKRKKGSWQSTQALIKYSSDSIRKENLYLMKFFYKGISFLILLRNFDFIFQPCS